CANGIQLPMTVGNRLTQSIDAQVPGIRHIEPVAVRKGGRKAGFNRDTKDLFSYPCIGAVDRCQAPGESHETHYGECGNFLHDAFLRLFYIQTRRRCLVLGYSSPTYPMAAGENPLIAQGLISTQEGFRMSSI